MKCLACGYEKLDFFVKPEHFKIEILKCRQCGAGILNPKHDYNTDDLYDYYNSRIGKSKAELYDPITGRRYKELLQEFKSQTNGQKILDVGCGQGQFVSAATEEGWDVRGIDMATGAIGIGKSFGLNVDKTYFFSSELDDQTFNIITMFELIEHVPNPSDFISRAFDLLNPGGLLYVTTPNFASLDRIILGPSWSGFHPEHLSYFTPKSFQLMVEKSTSYKLVSLKAVNISIAALKKLLGRTEKRASNIQVSSSAGAREKLESKWYLRAIKSLINSLLNLFNLGDALKFTYKKPKGPQ